MGQRGRMAIYSLYHKPMELRPSKLRRPTRVLGFLLVMLSLAFTTQLVSCTANKDSLVRNLTSQLRDQRFAELYGQGSEDLHLNVSQEEFLRRMTIALTKMKAIDGDLNFQRDQQMERSLTIGEPVLITVVLRLRKGDKSAMVLINWDKSEKFLDLSVMPAPGTSEGCAVYGVRYKTITPPPPVTTCP
jgi:hypothetical protein